MRAGKRFVDPWIGEKTTVDFYDVPDLEDDS